MPGQADLADAKELADLVDVRSPPAGEAKEGLGMGKYAPAPA